MKFNKFKDILNSKIFLEANADLIRKFATSPERYIGLFRPTKPKGKIIQNLTQSAEIKFGDAFEVLIEEYFKDFSHESLPKIFKKEGKKSYNLDQLFLKNNKIIFIEQKVRDDHDSTKKRGQIENFIRKIEILQDHYPNKIIEANFYFIDDSLSKNKNYYTEELIKIKDDYGIDTFLSYGEEIFNRYSINVWEEILEYLKEWKKEIPDMPEINFDNNVDIIFEQIKNIETDKFRKIFRNDEIFEKMMLTISPNRILLNKLLDYFKNEYINTNKKIYKTLSDLLSEKLGKGVKLD